MAIDLFTVGPITVHGYGLMIGLGFAAAILLGCYRAKRIGLSDEMYTGMAIWVLIIGFAGGKLLHILSNFKDFLANPLGMLGSEGFAVYGGIITGVLTVMVYTKVKKIDTLDYFDLLAPCVSINQAFGRLGCFMAGCCYGRETDSWMGVIFPEGCIAPAGVKLLPTQIFMAIGNALLCIGLIIYSDKIKNRKKGMVVALYVLLYSIGRYIVEIFRNDSGRGFIGPFSTSQFIAIWTFIGAIAFIVYLNRKSPKEDLKEANGESPNSDM